MITLHPGSDLKSEAILAFNAMHRIRLCIPVTVLVLPEFKLPSRWHRSGLMRVDAAFAYNNVVFAALEVKKGRNDNRTATRQARAYADLKSHGISVFWLRGIQDMLSVTNSIIDRSLQVAT